MFFSRIGRALGGGAVPAVAPLLVIPLLIGGCAKNPNQTAYVWPGSEPMQVAAAPKPQPPEIEDDGREAQLPPIRKARPEPDDPTQPWSPNYGKAAPAPAAPARAAVPDDLPPAFRRRLADAVAE